ncbi:MAG: AsmA-like C-terminal domain-containing protein [Magnetococcales bacterium]|nr:AsmA-like C-terminal domain-containing protein [Magnetococcales bacterium]
MSLLRRLFSYLILLPLLVLGTLSAWLTFFPPNLDHFIPQVNQRLTDLSGFQVKLTGLSAQGGLSFAVKGSGISFSLPQTPDRPFLQASSLQLRFSPLNWWEGWNSVGLIIEGADLHLHRDAKGEIFIGNQRLSAQEISPKKGGDTIPFSAISFGNSRVTWLDEKVINKKKPTIIQMTEVNASLLFQQDETLRLAIDAHIPAKGWTTTVSLKMAKSPEGSWIGEVKTQELHGETLRPYLADIQPLRGFSSPVNLESSLLWDGVAERLTAYWRLQAGWGMIEWPEMFRWPLPITGLIANGSLIMDKESARLEVGQFDLDNLHGKANGQLLLTDMKGEEPFIDLVADAGGVPVNKAKFYYPAGIMDKAVVDWLDGSLKNGIVNHANVKIKGPLSQIPFGREKKTGKKAWETQKKETLFRIEGEVSGLSLRYFPGILPLTNVQGSVLFDRKSFFAKVDSAHFGNSRKIQGEVKIVNLVENPLVDVAFQAKRADLTTLWNEVMASPTLKWDRTIGLSGSHLSGQGDLAMKIAVPLWKLSKTTFSGRLDFSEAKVKLPFFDPPFTNVKGWLNLDPKKIGISILESNFVDFPVHGQVNLQDYSQPKRVNFDARLNSSITEKRLSKWFSPLLGASGEFLGTAPFWLDIKRSANDPNFKVQAKLVADSLDIYGTMGWQKPEGETGFITGIGNLKLNGMLYLSSIQTNLGNLQFHGDGRWDLSSNQGELNLSSIELGNTRGRLGIAQTNPLASGLGDWLVRADLDELDLSAFWKTTFRPEIEPVKPTIDREWPRVNLKLKSKRVYLADRKEAGLIIANMDIEKRFFKLHTLQGVWGEGDVIMKGELLWPFQFGSGFYSGWFNIDSDDVGNLLESLAVHDEFMYGGSGTLDITLDGFIPPGGKLKDHLTGVGQIELRHGSFAKLDFFSTILGLFSLKDLPNLIVGDRPDLESKGFGYNSFQGELIFEDSVLRTELMSLNGPSMKIVLSGWVNLPDERLKLLIGIRPLQTLDSFISKVPLLGTLLAGNRKAVLETQFTVEGKLDDPEVTIRPFSSLVPGIIRDILNASDNGEEGEDGSQE